MEALTKFSGQKLRDVRHAKGWTQAELARRAGVRERQIIRWENEQNEPRLDAVAGLAQATSEPLSAFFSSPGQEAAGDGDPFHDGTGADVDGSAGTRRAPHRGKAARATRNATVTEDAA